MSSQQFKKIVEKNLRLIIVVGVVMGIIGLVAIAHNSATNLNSQPTADTQPTTTQSDTNPNTPSSSASTPALTPTPAPKPKPAPPTKAQQITSWYNQYGSSITALTNDFGQMGQAGTDSNAVEAACTQIFDDATKAEGQPPIPDTATENDWTNALNYYVNAAQDCQYGVNSSDVDQINKATGEFDQGNASLVATNKDIQKLR